MPELLTRMSTCPNSVAVRSTSSFTASASVMSVGQAIAFLPAAACSSTNTSSSFVLRAATQTRAPASANPCAIALPRPPACAGDDRDLAIQRLFRLRCHFLSCAEVWPFTRVMSSLNDSRATNTAMNDNADGMSMYSASGQDAFAHAKSAAATKGTGPLQTMLPI